MQVTKCFSGTAMVLSSSALVYAGCHSIIQPTYAKAPDKGALHFPKALDNIS